MVTAVRILLRGLPPRCVLQRRRGISPGFASSARAGKHNRLGAGMQHGLASFRTLHFFVYCGSGSFFLFSFGCEALFCSLPERHAASQPAQPAQEVSAKEQPKLPVARRPPQATAGGYTPGRAPRNKQADHTNKQITQRRTPQRTNSSLRDGGRHCCAWFRVI